MSNSFNKYIVFTLSFIFYYTSAIAQTNLQQKVSITFNSTPLKTVLDTLSAETGLSFFYSSDLINLDKSITVRVKNKPLKDVLYSIINDDRLLIIENGNQIIITENRQRKYTLSGAVFEKGSKELLIGVSVFVPQFSSGTMSNEYGFYSVTLPIDTYTIKFSYVGYTPVLKKIYLDKNTKLTIELEQNSKLQEVTIVSDEEKFSKSTLSVINIPLAEITKVPTLLGEQDAIKYLMLMPGVQKGNEGNNGMYVRGGGADQNLVMIDDATIYNAYHLLGVNSLFTGTELKKADLIKGGFSARYGGRLSSVLDMSIKDGNKERYGGEASLGLISSRIMLEGPIIKNKASFFISARRNHIDLLSRAIDPVNGIGYYYYDVHAKLNISLNDHNRLFVSSYLGSDRFFNLQSSSNNNDEIVWGNKAATLRWNHIFSSKVFSNTSLVYSEYSNRMSFSDGLTGLYNYKSGIRDFTAKFDMQFWPSLKHEIKSGLLITHHLFSPQVVTASYAQVASVNANGSSQLATIEGGAYLEDEMLLLTNLKLSAGLRMSYFKVEEKNYINPEPRISAVYAFPKNWFASSSYAWMKQYMHLLSSTGFGLPIDMWLPATTIIKPQQSQLITAGITKKYTKSGIEFSMEGYYKKIDNQIGFKEGSSFFFFVTPVSTPSSKTNWDNLVTQGQLWSYGSEWLCRKSKGRFTGWVSYTLSWTQMQFDEVNLGKKFYATYDRRHDLAAVLIIQLNKRFSSSVSWVYGTGNAISLPTSSYSTYIHDPLLGGTIINSSVYDYGQKNSYRMSPYHRLDVSLKYESKLTEKLKSIIELSIYNVYNRANAFYYTIDTNSSGKQVVRQTSLFPIIPSLSWVVKF